MKTAFRSHTCGALRAENESETVTLSGWVNVIRDQGGVLFVDLRDRYGVTQVTFRGDRDAALLETAERVRGEWVLRVEGLVIPRPAEARNPNLPTGDIEVEATALEVLSEAATPPFPLDERVDVKAETRLRHRYLDLRRARMTRNLAGRAQITSSVRAHLESLGFLEIETPTLLRSTPEGARDYLVPSRVRPGTFYALPQSPQLLKQLLMIGGQDRYFQVARCYRDEDLRADRQPEFTQVDVEASFVDEEDVYGFIEPLIAGLLQTWRGHEVAQPFPRMTYAEAMARFGSDKPDLRNPLELVDVGQSAAALDFKVFQSVVAEGGMVKALVGPGGASLSRKQIDAFDALARSMGAPGVAWAKITEEKATGPLGRFLMGDAGAAFVEAAGAGPGDLLLCAAGQPMLVHRVLSALRDSLAERLDLLDTNRSAVLWVTEFPLVEWNEDESRFDAMHHPFTSPMADDLETLFAVSQDPNSIPRERVAAIRARAYDLVIDGEEVGGGSIRIHRQDVQEAVFSALALDPGTVERRFGWFVEALQYGTPPHGGLALGHDRLVALLLGEPGIQEVLAFPKTLAAADLMSGAPAPVDPEQVGELGLTIVAEPEDDS